MEVRTIDYVVPMVFHDDKLWQEDFKRVNRCYDETNACDFVRYRSWGTEELLIRCIRKYMPFVRTIFIVLARPSQYQPWMEKYTFSNDAPNVKVVYHDEFIPERFLPTFNSATIEMFVYRIPNLSERFIYGNDDMFPLSVQREEDYFEGSVPCIHNEERPFPNEPNVFHMACMSGLNFVAREFGKSYSSTFLKGGHGITPMLKSTWEYLWHRGRKEIEASISPTRESRNFYQWICPWWHHFSGNYIDRVPKTVYVSTRNSVDAVVAALSASDAGIVCVNDNECVTDYMKYGDAVTDVINSKLEE